MSRTGGIERGDFVRVFAGPRRGERGTVMRVMRFPGESESAAMSLIRFPDESEGHHAGTNLEKVEAPQGAGDEAAGNGRR